MPANQTHRLEIVYPESSFGGRFSEPIPQDLTDLHPIGYIRTGQVFASAALQTEVEALQDAGGMPPNSVYHCTSSKALPRISEQKAILCSREALRIYGDIETGEIAHTLTDDWPPTVLDDVYAHNSMGTSYFFGDDNEYPVIFGIQGVSVQDAYGDGLKLGPTVPLDAVASVTVPADQLQVTKDWIAENCRPGTLGISEYAASLLMALA